MHHLGGMEQMAWDLARALGRLGARATVITTSFPGLSGDLVEDGVDVVALPATQPGRYSSGWWSASRRFLAAQSPSEVAAVLSISAAGFGLLGLKRHFPDTRFVMQAHGTSWDEIRSKWRSKNWRGRLSSMRNLLWLPKDLRAYRRFDFVVAVGDAVESSLARLPASSVLPRKKRRLIQNGVDTSMFTPDHSARLRLRAKFDVALEERIIISACRLHPQKGGAEAMRAFARYAETVQAARYWIAGEGPEQLALARLARELGVASRVAFLGRLARPDLAAHLAAADAFLFLGQRIEVGLPLNVLEALATGLPAVISAHLAPVSVAGLFPVDTGNTADAATQLGRAAMSDAPRRAMLPAEFDLAECAKNYLNLLCREP